MASTCGLSVVGNWSGFTVFGGKKYSYMADIDETGVFDRVLVLLLTVCFVGRTKTKLGLVACQMGLLLQLVTASADATAHLLC